MQKHSRSCLHAAQLRHALATTAPPAALTLAALRLALEQRHVLKHLLLHLFKPGNGSRRKDGYAPTVCSHGGEAGRFIAAQHSAEQLS